MTIQTVVGCQGAQLFDISGPGVAIDAVRWCEHRVRSAHYGTLIQ